MQIQYYGYSCFKISTKPAGRATDDVFVFFDPLVESSGLRAVYGQAHAVFFSKQEEKNLNSFKGNPIAFYLPGEYSVFGMNVIGADMGAIDDESKRSTVFLLQTEDIKLGFLGKLSLYPTEKQIELIDEVDVLFVPVGGSSVLDAKQAAELIRNTEPSIIIPMCYDIPGLKESFDGVKRLYDELGIQASQPVPKLVIKTKDLSDRKMDVIEIESQR